MIRVLVVDDSAVVRQVLCKELSKASDIEVVGTAIDPFVAREKILALKPDVLTLDLEMPRMGGLTFLAKLMKYYPLPVIVVSSLTPKGSEAAVRALQLGAVDVIAKPGAAYSVAEISQMLADRIRAAAAAAKSSRGPRSGSKGAFEQAVAPSVPAEVRMPISVSASAGSVLAIGASTGGTEAIKQVLSGLGADCPPTVIVQHMPAAFTAKFAERLNQCCEMEVREAADGDALRPGLALIAPGNFHMTLRKLGDGYRVEVKTGPAVRHQRPSVDVLFHSVARQAGPAALGVILTGMGDDGARGLHAMRQAGAATFAQDAQTCVVYGMPAQAVAVGAVEKVASLGDLSRLVLQALSRRSHAESRRESVTCES